MIKQLIKGVIFEDAWRPYRIRGGSLEGRRFYLNLRHDTQTWRGIYEVALQDWLASTIKHDSVCCDVGAAEGWVTLQMALRATCGIVYAFEPSARGEWIKKNLQLNKDRPQANVILEQCLVGALTESGAGGECKIALDDLVARDNVARIDVLKIDVDGFELDVLDGASRILNEYRPSVCVEVHSRELLDGVTERMQSARYSYEVIDAPPHEHRPIEYNPTVFARAK